MKFFFVIAASLFLLIPAQAQIDLQLEVVTGGVSQPVLVTHAGDGSGRLFVVERRGKIRVIDSSGNLLATPFLDIGSSGLDLIDIGFTEQGLLGLAFHPDYEINGRFFLNYTRTDGDTIVSEWQVSTENPNIAYATSEVVILGPIDQPEDNHNGGFVGFGPHDGFLYISLGDGGSGNDPHGPIGNGQNPGTLLGKILRIDVDSGNPYNIPPSNPFIGVAGFEPEIFALGFRNPWRMSFDSGGTHRMYVADVGQDAREEVSIVESGLNYGWRCFEGTRDTGLACGSATAFEDPVVEYNQSASRCSITGGYVYRGPTYPAMQGTYFFADYCSGDIWSLVETSPNTFTETVELDAPFSISAFGEDEAGEVFVCEYNQNNGAGPTSIYRLIDANQVVEPDIDVDPTSLPFGELAAGTASATMTVTLSNLGNGDLTFTSITLTGGDSDQFEFDPVPDSSDLGATESRVVSIRFTPTTIGLKTAALTIVTNDPNEGTVVIPLTGNAIEGASSVSRWQVY